MIIILPLNGAPAELFESYNELFEYIIESEKHSDTAEMNWRFEVFSSKQVVALYIDTKNPPAAMQEALEENLPLIEICTGSYKNPQYIVATPNVDMDYLKKKWCIDYCTFHNIAVKELG